jgi:hypothetical protein
MFGAGRLPGVRWWRRAALILAAAAVCCAAVAIAQWYARNYGTDDLVCRTHDFAVRAQPDCLDNRANPIPMAAVSVGLAAAAAMSWLRARRLAPPSPAGRAPSATM